jgi:hypothetical protein
MCADNKKCKACSIAGIFNNSKNQMKKSKLNFKGVSQSLVNGAAGAGLKMGVNFAISKLDKNGVLTGTKKGLVSLAVPVLASVLAPKLVAKPIVKGAIEGHIAITMFELGSGLLPADIAAQVSGYNPVSMAGYNPVAMAGAFPKLPYQKGVA